MHKATHAEIIEKFCNALELAGVTLVLFATLVLQFWLNEEPCPLCLLQRIGLFGVALGFLLNLRFGLNLKHYAIIILSSLFTSFVALRQIALNLDSPTGGFGTPILGLHLYTWSFIVSMLILIVTTIVMSIDRKDFPVYNAKFKVLPITKRLFALIMIMLLINLIITIPETVGSDNVRIQFRFI